MKKIIVLFIVLFVVGCSGEVSVEETADGEENNIIDIPLEGQKTITVVVDDGAVNTGVSVDSDDEDVDIKNAEEEAEEDTKEDGEEEDNQPTQEFTISADEHAFDPDEIDVIKGALVRITFEYNDNKIYYGGLDIKCDNCDYFDTIQYRKDGEPDTIEFVAEKSFTYTSYWPASATKKATGRVTVGEE